MDRNRMLAILATLADGIDPVTGEAFPAESPYQHPQTVRALCLAVRYIEGGSSRAETATSVDQPAKTATSVDQPSETATSVDQPRAIGAETGPGDNGTAPEAAIGKTGRGGKGEQGGNAGKAWSPEEDERLAAAFDGGKDTAALAIAHGRSRLAIEIRLAKLGRLPMPGNARYGRGNPPPPQAADSARPRYAIAA